MFKFIALLLVCVAIMSSKNIVRKYAVAGSFYPSTKDSIEDLMSDFFTDGIVGIKKSWPEMLIVPHAGYIFSGKIAADAYAKISQSVNKVIILAPAHRVYFKGVSVPSFLYYETPLGRIAVNEELRNKFFKKFNNASYDKAHIEEHAIEVQLPFLQTRLKDFTILPILICDMDNRENLVSFLDDVYDDNTLIIISSDLSHYKKLSDAKTIDSKTIKTIKDLSANGFLDACGAIPIRVGIDFAKLRKLKPKLISRSNSYIEAPQYCSEDRVVGYASFEFTESDDELVFTDEEKKTLLKIARESLDGVVLSTANAYSGCEIKKLNNKYGCFVTLTVNDNLRGCIGYIEPVKPLALSVFENAKNAAVSDQRFNPIAPYELDKIKIEISILSEPAEIHYSSTDNLLDQIEPFVDGLILEKGFRRSTFLPQVWEKIPDKITFLRNLSAKAGLPEDSWQSAKFRKYRVIHFSE